MTVKTIDRRKLKKMKYVIKTYAFLNIFEACIYMSENEYIPRYYVKIKDVSTNMRTLKYNFRNHKFRRQILLTTLKTGDIIKFNVSNKKESNTTGNIKIPSFLIFKTKEEMAKWRLKNV